MDKDIAALKADVQMLKDKAPSASVAMADVSFHWSNLRFAGQTRTGPLRTMTTAKHAIMCDGSFGSTRRQKGLTVNRST